MIDLRSDTVTLPTPEMREAIARAELGDDVYGEDPTVNRLEAMAASAMGKEAALLVASGTMGNLIAMLVHCARGTKAVLGARAHTYLYEAGGAAALGGVVLTPVRNSDDGEFALDELANELATPADPHFAPHALVAMENTHNRCGGEAIGLAHMAAVAELARRNGLAVHLDGARIFNAALALEASATGIAAHADTVSFCLSKGLACPAGTMLCGPRPFVERARRTRKMLGGGMRQAGIIAAAGIVALTAMIDRLAEDHENARALAEGLGRVAGLRVHPARRRTNMVFFEVAGGPERAAGFAAALCERGVLIGARSPVEFRAVTHYGVSGADIERAILAAGEAAAKTASAAAAAPAHG